MTAGPLASPEGWQVSVPCWLVGKGIWMAVEVMAVGAVEAMEAGAPEAGAYGGQGDAVGADGGWGSWRLGCWS